MKHYIPYLFWVGFCFLSLTSSAQFSIDFPTDRAVFQRDKGNHANIYISGTYTTLIDKVEARIEAMNQGASTEWTPMDLAGGFFFRKH